MNIRCLALDGDPGQRGRTHGTAYPKEIRRYTDERVALATNGSWAGGVTIDAESVLKLAESMLPAHERYAPDLFEEMCSLGEACGHTPAEMVIVGGFTDFVDAVRALGATTVDEDDCTATLVPDTQAGGAGFLAQTWDMHDSATEHVVLFELQPPRGPAALVFSTLGCVGQIGMNDAGIAVGINNLSAARGQAGVTWPFVVRKALQQTELEDALGCVLEAELAGAHNYLLFDRHGRGYNVEAMPGLHRVQKLEAEPLLHTNHCLDAETKRLEAVKHPSLVESSHARLARAGEILSERPITRSLLMAFTRDPGAICQRAKPPLHMESSGAAIMRPATGDFWAVWGIPADNEYEHFRLEVS
jgi:isopenicillin-N N-acyltransferase-like protein